MASDEQPTVGWLPAAPEGSLAPTAAELAGAITIEGISFGPSTMWAEDIELEYARDSCIVEDCMEHGAHPIIGRLPSGFEPDSPLKDTVLGLICIKHHAQILEHAGADFSLTEWPRLTAARCCRVCGCTDDNACLPPAGPCHWVELDLCSACEPKEPCS